MPLCSNPNDCLHKRQPGAQALARPPAASVPSTSRCLSIGLVNNMPDAALEATERQFRSLLASASDGLAVRLSLYALPGVPRGEAGRRHIEAYYAGTDTLGQVPLDALIVTGAEPRAADLREEPYWHSFTGVVEWARDNTRSTIFSCLAAHAALLHLDGIGRLRSGQKHFGLFECEPVADHWLTAGVPARFPVPHSRWNGIDEAALAPGGYRVLTRSAVGVDTFLKREKSLFVFFQGHPEYESDTLLREYRRDAARYLQGETGAYPSAPLGYCDPETVSALDALLEPAIRSRPEELLAQLSQVLQHCPAPNTWQTPAAQIYKNWLNHLQEQKEIQRQLTAIDPIAEAPRTIREAAERVASAR